MKNTIKLLICLLIGTILPLNAQVKISDSGNTAPNANAILHLESTTKGFVPPHVPINDLADDAPMTAPPTGTLVYSEGGSVSDGYYIWNGSSWELIVTGVIPATINLVPKSATGNIANNETFILASGDITLTLPVITGADNGLAITVKNVGTHTDVVQVDGNGAATIDGITGTSKLYRWKSRTYIAYGGNWIKKEKEIEMSNTFDVGPNESWTTIPEVLEFLDLHITVPSVVRLDGGTYTITATQTINLSAALTIQGPSYGQAYIVAGGALTDAPMFSCETEVSFKMIAFESGAGTFGDDPGENALDLVTDAEYHEIKDCTLDGFYDAIKVTGDVDMWLFETDILDCTNGVEVATDAAVSFYTSESDFSNCTNAINLVSSNGASVSVQNCTFTCVGAQYGMLYNRGSAVGKFRNIESLFFTNNTWNNVGTFISGFDFANNDGLDANVEILNNAGIGDKNPHCKINVVNNATTTTVTTANTYYKVVWSDASDNWNNVNLKVENNKITFLPKNKKDMVIYISGNVSSTRVSTVVTIGVKKNAGGTNYGEITLRFPNALLATTTTILSFSTIVYLQDVAQTDYFEVFCTTDQNGDVLTFSDMNIYATSQ